MHFPHAPHRSDYFTIFRKGDWKLIYHYFPAAPGPAAPGPAAPGQASRYQLFSLSEDPFEQRDLAESNPAVLKELVALMTSSLDQQKALYPVDQQGAPVRPVQP
jgi:arylsulfatase A-like enzyme